MAVWLGMLNWKCVEVIVVYFMVFTWRNWRKPRTNHVRMPGLLTDTETGDLCRQVWTCCSPSRNRYQDYRGSSPGVGREFVCSLYRASRCSGWFSCFLFMRSQVLTSFAWLGIVIDCFMEFLDPSIRIPVHWLRIGHDHSISSPNIPFAIILPFR
jgi:hypothetical protein